LGTLIDSSIFVALERGKLTLPSGVSLDPEGDYFISAVTVFELLDGVYRAETAARKATREAFVERVIREIPVIPFDEQVARGMAPLKVTLTKSGNTIALADLMIAATALAHHHDVATLDKKSFSRVPGLVVTNW
jgi:tRNA(fMet)-specific endonuclease VapC